MLSGLLPALAVGLSADADRGWQVAFAGGVIAVCVAPVARRVARGRFDLFEPIVFAAAMLILLFGIRPMWMAADGRRTVIEGGPDANKWFDYAALGGFIGCLALVVGYELGMRYWARRLEYHDETRSIAQRGVTPVAIAFGVLG